MEANNTEFKVGDRVAKRSGDYVFDGVVMSVFRKRDNRSVRYVVENDDGVVHIFHARQLEPWVRE